MFSYHYLPRRSVLGVHWRDWCWSWNSDPLATWWEELIHLKRPWFWEWLKVGGQGNDRGWDGWMASPIQWTWVWVSSGSWWWTGRPGVVQSIGSQIVRHDWATELNWTDEQLDGVFCAVYLMFLMPIVHWACVYGFTVFLVWKFGDHHFFQYFFCIYFQGPQDILGHLLSHSTLIHHFYILFLPEFHFVHLLMLFFKYLFIYLALRGL